MPSLNDVIEIAELLKSKPVIAAEERCVAVRNRNATCRKCVDACIASCIDVGQNSLEIDSDACVNCGVCVTVCPTSAIVGLDPVAEDLVADSVEARNRCESAVGASGMPSSPTLRLRTRSGSEPLDGSERAKPESRTPFGSRDGDWDAEASEVGAVPLVLACARVAARKESDTALHETVPCLGRVDEETLVALVKATGDGVPVVLVDGNCATCKYGAVSPFIDEAVAGAETLLDAFGVPGAIERVSEFPECVKLKPGEAGSSLRGRERRSLLKDAKRFAGTAAKTAAEKAIADALNQKKPGEPTLRERLKVNPHGALPTFRADRNLDVLDDLFELAEEVGELVPITPRQFTSSELKPLAGSETLIPTSPTSPASSAQIDTRLFGSVTIDASICTGCGMCAMFCPTGALKFSEVAQPQDPEQRYLEFQAADCTQCNLCADVCLHHCVAVSSQVTLAELIDLEPRLIATPKPKKSVDIFKQSRKARSQHAGK